MNRMLMLLLFLVLNTNASEILIKANDNKEIKDSLVEMMVRLGYSIGESNDYKISFKKEITKGSNFFGDTFSYAMDGTRVSEEGFEYTIIPIGDTTKIINTPYTISTRQNGSNPVKSDASSNYNKSVMSYNLLVSLRNIIFFKEYNKTAKEKINNVTIGSSCSNDNKVWSYSNEAGFECKSKKEPESIMTGSKCESLGKKWEWNGNINQWECRF